MSYVDVTSKGLDRWEATKSFMYLDTYIKNGVPSPLVTTGKGCAISINEAVNLPFYLGDRPATQQEINQDFLSIKSAPFGYVADFYAKFSKVRLKSEGIEELVRKRFVVFIAGLEAMFPEFDSFPESAKAGCLDLIYGLGVAGLDKPHYPLFHKSVENKNWKTASLQCDANASMRAYDQRNQARRNLFIQAAHEANL